MNEYIPSPINTDDVELSEELQRLTELLAKNTHEIWALQRRKEGYRYGETRDDEKKLHPDMVPYEELPETEKEYDRATSMNTLKLIQKLGYEIRKGKDFEKWG